MRRATNDKEADRRSTSFTSDRTGARHEPRQARQYTRALGSMYWISLVIV